jgi:PPOX class probable F420-dependent enzyme
VDTTTARRLFATASVARLATISAEGRPHLVPIVFALEADIISTAVDHKAKTTTRLVRLANVERDPRVAVLADHYEDDWDRLWWVRADGSAALLHSGANYEEALDRLAERYSQYRSRRPPGPVIEVTVDRWTGWQATRPQ